MSKVALGTRLAIASKGFKSLYWIKPWEILKAIDKPGRGGSRIPELQTHLDEVSTTVVAAFPH